MFIYFSNDTSIAGSSNRFINIPINKVIEVSSPNATVPPKVLKAKMINPQKSITEVYTILTPLSRIESLTAGLIAH